MKYKKIGGGLLGALEDSAQEGPAALASHTRMLGMAPVAGNQKPPRAIVFIHCDDKAELDVADLGIRLNQTRGRVRTALLPLDRLDELSENSRVKRILPSRKLRPCLNLAGPRVKLPEFKNSTGLDGDGVVVGIIDSGIDPNHPEFQGRILSIWDQTLSGPGVAEGPYGLELTGNLLVASRDTDGHGTHVAGIAAGAGATFQGVAPKAELIVVKTTFQDAHIADAIRYVFRRAAELGRPAVVNLSLGGHFDAHDGSDSLSQVIDDESGPGRIVVCAAGNEGGDNIHARVKLGQPATRTVKFQVPPNSVRVAGLNGWYPGAGKLEVSITSPSGLTTPFQRVVTTGNFRRQYQLSNARVVVETPGPDPDNGDHNFSVEIRPSNPSSFVPSGRWELRVKNANPLSGDLDVWMLDGEDSPQVVGTGATVADSHKIGSPGCASAAVTVAAFVTRSEWQDVDGEDRAVGLTLDTIAEFSSEGPLRNGQRKPDVTAPGAMIVSCLSADSGAERSSLVDSRHKVEAGTSMACPFIAGVIALLLQRNPQLDPVAIKAALKSASRIPSKPAGHFDIKWGFGLIQVDKL